MIDRRHVMRLSVRTIWLTWFGVVEEEWTYTISLKL